VHRFSGQFDDLRRPLFSGVFRPAVFALALLPAGCTTPVIDPARETLRAPPPSFVPGTVTGEVLPGTANLSGSSAAAHPVSASSDVGLATVPPAGALPVGPQVVELERLLGNSAREGPSVYHEVRAGETVQTLSVRYRVDAGRLIRVNGLSTSAPLTPGQLLYIPDQSRR
jgi:hypothetical protein